MPEKFTVIIGQAKLCGEKNGEGEPLIFLHAGVADRRMWRSQMAELGDNFLTVAYDRRGFGETETADEAFSHAEDLRALLDQLNISKASLAGCSQGGRVAIDFALAYPQRIGKVVLIASAVSGAPAPTSLPPGVEALENELDEAEEAGDLQRVNEIEAQFWLDGPTSPAGRVAGGVRDLFLDMNGIALAMPDLEQEIEPASAYERLSDLSMPVLVLWGDLDFPHLQQRCRYLAKIIPGARGGEIPGTAHLPNLEQPDAVNELLCSFLGE